MSEPRTQDALFRLVDDHLTAPLQALEEKEVHIVLVAFDRRPGGVAAVAGTVSTPAEVVALLLSGLKSLQSKFTLEQLTRLELVCEDG